MRTKILRYADVHRIGVASSLFQKTTTQQMINIPSLHPDKSTLVPCKYSPHKHYQLNLIHLI